MPRIYGWIITTGEYNYTYKKQSNDRHLRKLYPDGIIIQVSNWSYFAKRMKTMILY